MVSLPPADKFLPEEISEHRAWDLTCPVPLDNDGISAEAALGKNPDVHYVYVCIKVSYQIFASIIYFELCSALINFWNKEGIVLNLSVWRVDRDCPVKQGIWWFLCQKIRNSFYDELPHNLHFFSFCQDESGRAV